MNIVSILDGLTPEAQIILLICLLILSLGTVVLLLVVAFSPVAADNLCNLATTIARLFKPDSSFHAKRRRTFKSKTLSSTRKSNGGGQ
jgi:hypothetical protein